MWQGKYYTNNARNTRNMHTIFQHKLKGIIVSLQWNILISIFQFHNVVLFRVLGLIQVNFTQNLTVSGRNPGVLSLLTWQFAIPKHSSVLKHWQRLCLILLLIFVDILRMMFTYCDYKYSITYKKSCQNRDQILVMFTTCYWTFCEGIQKDKLVTQSVWT